VLLTPTAKACDLPGSGVEIDGRVMILGAYGMGNVGDEAILAGLLARARDKSRLVVVSGAPAETSALHGVRAISPKAAPAALRNVDAVVIGGGGLFSAHMGTAGRMIPLFGLSALAMGKTVTLEGVSVDRRLPAISRPFLIRLARRAARVVVRDAQSMKILRSWGVRAVVEPDLSLYLDPAPASEAETILTSMGFDPTQPIVGLCLTAVEPELDPFLRAIPGVIERFSGVQFCFVPMSRHRSVTRHNDAVLAARIQGEAPALRVVQGVYHPREVLGLFSHFSAAVCMRFHSFLFADRMGTPIIGVPYAQKCESWLQERGISAAPANEQHLVDAIGAAIGGEVSPACYRENVLEPLLELRP